MDFQPFKQAIAAQFERMQQTGQLWRVDLDRDQMWDHYLDAFPAGNNEVFRKRREYDCSCCRSFVKTVGNVVAIIDGKIETIWSIDMGPNLDPGFIPVANRMHELVHGKKWVEPFLHYERKIGTERSLFENMDGDAGSRTLTEWHHFAIQLLPLFVMAKGKIPTKLNDMRGDHDVFLRSLTELNRQSVATVLELIDQNSLYRGAEFRHTLSEFQQLQHTFLTQAKSDKQKDVFAWVRTGVKSTTSGPVRRLRNTAIGTLLRDLSEDMDLEDAVRKFEASTMAPSNYKRPTALVSKAMLDRAKATIEEAGLTSALDRRFATLKDITVQNILFVDRTSRKNLGGNPLDDLAPTKGSKLKLDKVEEIGIEQFIKQVVPNVSSIEVMFENRHASNLVSLIAPADPTAGQLMKWDNRFSWDYNGNAADSIKERVKAAGGNVSGDLCCRLAWFNFDDLDFHMIEPHGYEIHFGNRHSASPSGGRLDVDMNAGQGTTREAVENIFYASERTMKQGIYELVVHNFSLREKIDIGFEVEIDWKGEVHRFVYDRLVNDGQSVLVARLKYSHEKGIEILDGGLKGTAGGGKGREVWGLQTQQLHPVNVLMLSPNFWDGQLGIGNKHWFFMLDRAHRDVPARGFYNEFLSPALNEHRKVLELVGGKLPVQEAAKGSQLSGLGFSSTQRNELVCRVSGNFTRVLKVIF